jgi:hypothetical protein
LVESQDSLALADLVHRSEHIRWVLFMVVDFTGAAEDFSLHPSSDQPERICNDVTRNACDACRSRVKFEIPLLPLKASLKRELDCLIHREIQSVEKRGAERGDIVAAKQAFDAFSVPHTRNGP